MSGEEFHRSVLYQEVLNGLNIKSGEVYVDATLGGGGHTKGILKLGGRVIGIDVDPDAIDYVKNQLNSDRLILEQGNFVDIDKILGRNDIYTVSGVLLDLGVSSFQLDSSSKGFGLKRSGPLDMRMDPALKVKASDLVNGLNEGELYGLFSKFGEERYARRIARAIVRSRSFEKIERTEQLAKIVEEATNQRFAKIHPATRVFLALRVTVNNELDNLRCVLPKAMVLLKKEGRLAVISFHSLEDKVVKNYFKECSILSEINNKPIVPSKREIIENPRARSAKLRIAEKIN